MSLEAWGDELPNDGYVTDARAEEMASEAVADAISDLRHKLSRVHDEFHGGSMSTAHLLLCEVLGIEPDAEEPPPVAGSVSRFEQAFKAAARKCGVSAAFVVADTRPDRKGNFPLMVGGNSEICQIIKKAGL